MNYFDGNTVGNNGHKTAGMTELTPNQVKDRVSSWLKYATKAEKAEMKRQLLSLPKL